MAPSVEKMIEQLVGAVREKLLARRGFCAEAQKLIIEVSRRPDDSFDIKLSGKTR